MRVILGILLPGAILVLVFGYVCLWVLLSLDLGTWIKTLLQQEFLLIIVLFVAVYLAGSLLRLDTADRVDERSQKRFVGRWSRKHRATPDFVDCRAKLASGHIVPEVPQGFDEWLCVVDRFPYPAWQNRKWQVHGPREVLEFFRQDRYRDSMWAQGEASPKSFFNYCKLAVTSGNSPLTDEIDAAEGLTRFYAGTVAALRISAALLPLVLAFQLLHIAGLWFVRDRVAGLGLSTDLRVHVGCVLFTLAAMAVSWLVCSQIIGRFRRVRAKEAGIVYHAFYLTLTSRGCGGQERGHRVD
jgi:hypothetical protein